MRGEWDSWSKRGLFNRFKKSPISSRGKEGAAVCSPGETGCSHRERSKWDRRGDVNENVIFHFNGRSSSVSFSLSDSSVVPSASPFICFSLFPPSGDSTVAPLSAIPSPSLPSRSSFVSLFLSPLLPFLLFAPADSTAFFYLGANVLIACGRSSRPSRVPFPSVSSSSWLLGGHRSSKWLR